MEERIRAAWQGRISGCLLGKPLEMLSMREGFDSLQKYLKEAKSLPLRDYVNYIENPNIEVLLFIAVKIEYLKLKLMTI